jgi:hypothetical protein
VEVKMGGLQKAEGGKQGSKIGWPLAVSCLLLAASCTLITPAWAQEDGLTLFVHRNFGYGGGSQIRGSFRMEADGPTSLASVTFKIDDLVVGTVTAPPFRVDFNTSDYALGWHTLSAEGQTNDARTLISEPKRLEFVSSEAEWGAVRSFLVPLLSLVGGIFLIAILLPLAATVAGRKATLPLGAPRKYGVMGGAACPKCGRPFAIHLWSLNAGLQKFDRCDYCGKWSLVRRMSPEKLAEAEAAELKMAQPETPIAEKSAEEKLAQQLDESRFFDES